jgi:RHS repeat-associated protein
MQRDYYPFGQTLNAAGDDLTSMQFSQKQIAPDSTIYYFGVRYYSPRIGRWLVPDPAGQGFSPYVYCGNNPLNMVDPDGALFGIDGLIVSGVSFFTSYISTGMSTGNWGKDALMNGLIAAGSAWLGYNTGGAAAGLFSAPGSASYAIGSASIAGAVGGATGSAASQLYYTGKVNLDDVGFSAGYGLLSGFAGGVSGQFITPDPVLTSMIGGTAGGWMQSGDFHGAFMGAWWGGIDASLTIMSYEAYGRYLTNKYFKENAYGEKVPGYDCKSFANEMMKNIPGDQSYADFEVSHWGVDIGGTKYGQHMILSKEGGGGPITVLTGRQLSTGNGTFVKPGTYYNPYSRKMQYWGGYRRYNIKRGW